MVSTKQSPLLSCNFSKFFWNVALQRFQLGHKFLCLPFTTGQVLSHTKLTPLCFLLIHLSTCTRELQFTVFKAKIYQHHPLSSFSSHSRRMKIFAFGDLKEENNLFLSPSCFSSWDPVNQTNKTRLTREKQRGIH